ncbi:hypothetical protein, partial [Capnocytophaga gingivalis]
SAGGDVTVTDGATLAAAGAVKRAVAGGPDSTLLIQAPVYSNGLTYGLEFGDRSRADGFTFRGTIRTNDPVYGGVSATFQSGASIVIDRP